MHPRLRLIAPAVALSLLACMRVPTDPLPRSFHMTLSLSSPSGDPSRPITAVARLTNIGRRPIVFTTPCGSREIRLAIWNPDRSNVIDGCACPNVLCVTCPNFLVRLDPGESVTTSVVFNGTLRSCDGPFQGASGVYTVEASFKLQTPDGAQSGVTRSATFDWAAAATS